MDVIYRFFFFVSWTHHGFIMTYHPSAGIDLWSWYGYPSLAVFAGLVWRSHGLQYGTGLEGREKHLGIATLGFVFRISPKFFTKWAMWMAWAKMSHVGLDRFIRYPMISHDRTSWHSSIASQQTTESCGSTRFHHPPEPARTSFASRRCGPSFDGNILKLLGKIAV